MFGPVKPGTSSSLHTKDTDIVSHIDPKDLEKFLGSPFNMSFGPINQTDFSSGVPVTITGNVYTIKMNDAEYQVSPSSFTRQIGFGKASEHAGFFNGLLDETGVKIIDYFFFK